MIIAAYAGTGKTTFACHTENAIDIPSMPHSWILPPEVEDGLEHEGEKGAPYFLHNPLFPDNYILDILRAEQGYSYVLIPTDSRIISILQEKFSRKVMLCYPPSELKEEYKERYIKRGNSEEFVDLFIGSWDTFLKPICDNNMGVHIVLKSGQFLTDVVKRFDLERAADRSEPIPEIALKKIKDELEQRSKEYSLYISGDYGYCIYPISNLNDPDEHLFLYSLGRKIYESTELISVVAPTKMLKKGNCERGFWSKSRERVACFVEQEITI